jgi:hypothetical protein
MEYTKSIMARVKLASNAQILNLYRLVKIEIKARGLE